MHDQRNLRKVRRIALAAAVICVGLLSGCAEIRSQLGLGAPAEAAPTTAVTPTAAAPTLDAPATDLPSEDEPPVEDEPGEVVLTVWMPEALAPSSETRGGQELLEQLAAFDESHPDIRVEFYPKRSRGPGSMIAYLRSARPVAPEVLPDLVLLSRDSLIEAAREGLIVPMGALVDPAIPESLYPVAVDLGTVDGELAGLVYLVEFQHIVYRQVFFDTPPNSFGEVLDSPVPYLFPAGVQDTVSRTVLAQYLASGGTVQDEDGGAHLDAEPLREVLTFYASAVEEGVIDTSLFQVSDPAVTWSAYTDRQAGLATVTSTLYLAGRANLPSSTGLSWIPTASGQPFALVSGWSWAVVATDPGRQDASMALVNFLMNPVNHGKYSQAVGWVPSQGGALNVWGEDDPYLAFGNQVLNNAAPVPDPLPLAAVGPAIQTALEAVLLQDALPLQAATEAVEMVNPESGESP